MVHGVEETEADLRSEAVAEAGSEGVAMPEAEAVARTTSMGKEEGLVSITDHERPQPIPKLKTCSFFCVCLDNDFLFFIRRTDLLIRLSYIQCVLSPVLCIRGCLFSYKVVLVPRRLFIPALQ